MALYCESWWGAPLGGNNEVVFSISWYVLMRSTLGLRDHDRDVGYQRDGKVLELSEAHLKNSEVLSS